MIIMQPLKPTVTFLEVFTNQPSTKLFSEVFLKIMIASSQFIMWAHFEMLMDSSMRCTFTVDSTRQSFDGAFARSLLIGLLCSILS